MYQTSIYLAFNTSEEHDQSEASLDSFETERLQEVSFISDWLDTSSSASSDKKGSYLTPKGNG